MASGNFKILPLDLGQTTGQPCPRCGIPYAPYQPYLHTYIGEDDAYQAHSEPVSDQYFSPDSPALKYIRPDEGGQSLEYGAVLCAACGRVRAARAEEYERYSVSKNNGREPS